ncbi:hypothetical protein L6452_27880 [Arctium lappa]|uniref:Uncharacterized protein n=1 Tax=Arctium lappa TaxID=4217 RepID=A0ACB8ZWS2_ARCLA|nr:hypothetical protein L6452_27880 [Arctium lappa]
MVEGIPSGRPCVAEGIAMEGHYSVRKAGEAESPFPRTFQSAQAGGFASLPIGTAARVEQNTQHISYLLPSEVFGGRGKRHPPLRVNSRRGRRVLNRELVFGFWFKLWETESYAGYAAACRPRAQLIASIKCIAQGFGVESFTYSSWSISGALPYIVVRTCDFVAIDSKCLAHNSDCGLLCVMLQYLVKWFLLAAVALLTSKLSEQALSENAYDGATDDDGEALQKAMILLSQHYHKKFQHHSGSNNLRFTPGSKNVKVPEVKKAAACFNCRKSGHIAKECRVKVVRDSAYYRKKLELAEKRENGTALLAEEEFWLDHSDEEADNVETAHMCFIGVD